MVVSENVATGAVPNMIAAGVGNNWIYVDPCVQTIQSECPEVCYQQEI